MEEGLRSVFLTSCLQMGQGASSDLEQFKSISNCKC